MFRVALLCLAIFAAAGLEFTVFPGHSYLEGDTQLYLPMLERVDSPGLLSRDLVATNPTLTLTAYDEVTLLLHEAGRQPFRRALLGQEFMFRIAALFGVFFLARATGLSHLFALIVAAIVNLGAWLAGPAVFLTDREPLPGPFAFALTLLAMGLLANEKPLLAGVAGGVAFLYDPILALPFWAVSLAAFTFDRDLRHIVRPTLPIFLVFLLLLANLAQLQPGAAGDSTFSHIPAQLAAFQRTYTPYLYVASWPASAFYQLLGLCLFTVLAASRSWELLSKCFRWFVLGTAICGVLAIGLSYLLIDRNYFIWAARLQPARALLFTVSGAALLFGLAGMRAVLRRRPWEALGWFFLLFTLSARVSVVALLLAALLTGLLVGFAGGRARFVTLAAPVLACLALSQLKGSRPAPIPYRDSIAGLAAWAEASTWGSSVFLFSDAEKELWPGVFRAQSRHALWADWKSAQGVAFSASASAAWEQQWRQTMQSNLQKMLSSPVDYYVLKAQHRLANQRAVFANRDFVVYDAQDLRNSPQPLR